MYHGKITSDNLGEILEGEGSGWKYDLKVTSLDAGYLIIPSLNDLPLDIYLKSGFAYFDEDGVQNDIYELSLYLKMYYNIDIFRNRLRIGLGGGASYTSAILSWEKDESLRRDDKTSRLLSTLDISIDLDVGRLFNAKNYYGTYLGVAIKHRSGAKGFLSGVEHSGSNYTGLYLEKNF